MQLHLVTGLVLGLALSGCGQKETPAPKSAPVASHSLPSLATGQSAPPPPVASPNAAAAPVQAGNAVADVPTFEGKDEAEKLTWALRAYGQNPNAPAISNFEPLVKARLIKSVPVPPPGKKYVIDMKTIEVRLVNQ